MSEKFLAIDDQDESVVKKEQYKLLSSLLFLFKFTKGERGPLWIAVILLILFSAFAMYSGHAMGVLVGEGLIKRNWEISIKFSVIVVVAELLSLGFHYFGRKMLVEVAGKTILNIRVELFSILPKLPMNFYDRWPRGRVVTRLTHDVEGVESFFSGSLGRVLHSVFLAFASIVAMMISSPKLGIIIVLSMFPSILLVLVTKSYINKLNRAMSRYSGQINSKLSEFIDGLYVIRSFGLENWSHSLFSETVKKHVDATLKSNMFYSFTTPVIAFLCGLPILVLLFVGGNAVLNETLSITIFFAFLRYTERFFSPMMILFREVHVILQSFTSAQRVSNFLRESAEDESFVHESPTSEQVIDGEVEFKNVWMKYSSSDWTLKNISFKIQPGQKVGLVGTSGSGKTSCISVLCRLYEFQKGEVFIDKTSIRHWDIKSFRDQLGLVFQEASIFKGPLKDNLSVDPLLSEDDILETCKLTGLDKVMVKAKLTLETMIHEGGANLSAGQRQVISLTRTCLLSPRILILDEATANVDEFHEKILHDGIERVMHNKTTFIIAHRLETVAHCDLILVFDQGEIIEVGSPADLMKQQGLFFKLASQS